MTANPDYQGPSRTLASIESRSRSNPSPLANLNRNCMPRKAAMPYPLLSNSNSRTAFKWATPCINTPSLGPRNLNTIRQSRIYRNNTDKSSFATTVQTYATPHLKSGKKPALCSMNVRKSRASSPARAQHATNSSSFAASLPGAKMFTLMDIAEKTEASAIRQPAQTSGRQAFAPKQPNKESDARSAQIASSPN